MNGWHQDARSYCIYATDIAAGLFQNPGEDSTRGLRAVVKEDAALQAVADFIYLYKLVIIRECKIYAARFIQLYPFLSGYPSVSEEGEREIRREREINIYR